jgi:hypothetical protein
MAITKAARDRSEKLIYEVMDALDKTKTNSDAYKKQFSKMDDAAFEKLFKGRFPLRFYTDTFNIEPKQQDLERAAKVLKIPLLEKVNLPHIYRNEEGVAVQSKICHVGYIHIKKVQQFLTKKNSMSTNIDSRDMKTGLLINYDKNGKTSDKEAEALITMGLDATVAEFTGFKADSINAKNIAYNTINTTGQLSLKDIPFDQEDSLAKKLMDVYMIGAMLKTNVITDSYLLPYYAKEKKNAVQRA